MTTNTKPAVELSPEHKAALVKLQQKIKKADAGLSFRRNGRPSSRY
jgi:hypothetical protein